MDATTMADRREALIARLVFHGGGPRFPGDAWHAPSDHTHPLAPTVAGIRLDQAQFAHDEAAKVTATIRRRWENHDKGVTFEGVAIAERTERDVAHALAEAREFFRLATSPEAREQQEAAVDELVKAELAEERARAERSARLTRARDALDRAVSKYRDETGEIGPIRFPAMPRRTVLRSRTSEAQS
jgi:hypothetical protein